VSSPRGRLEALASAVRERRVSAEELVLESVRRIERAQDVNAVVALHPEEAAAEARALDPRLARGEEAGPLAGLPLLVKDIEDARGFPTTFGSLLFADAPPAERDGVQSKRLRGAGAILLGKTNTPEFALFGHTANRLFGATRNPWNQAYSPGGSSGGSGAALAAGLAPLATATDVGGSIRIPAAACGLVGLKPSAGRVGRDPILGTPDMNHMGPLAPTVADARLLLSLLAGPVAGDPFSLPAAPIGPDRLPQRLLAAARFAPAVPLQAEIDSSFREAVDAVEAAIGVPAEALQPEQVLPSGFDPDDWGRIIGAEQAYALGRERIEREADRLDTDAREFLEFGLSVSTDEYAAARSRRYRYTLELDRLLGEDGVLLTPTLTVDGWTPEGRTADGESLPWWVFNTEVANFTGHPAISVPAGRTANGVPFGLQIIGPRFGDEVVLGVAAAFEASRPWPPVAHGHEPFEV
jgi:Asp-tRNA(Asn)/Glu-tRNA(Gln) amidotransferase A subunit family amidase